ncbi:MAG: futalosine hydrolase [Prevotellaceae bacterium]|jgi:futalosine hydrolase|nr:futalosine hydrolase [Prevotellaceae bacterium]
MNILITSATELELKPVREQLSGKINADFAVTGVGATATAYNLTKLLTQNKYKLAINVGIAGSFNSDLPVGTVTEVACEIFGDSGIFSSTGFSSCFEENLIPSNAFPFNDGTLHSPYRIFPSLKKVVGLTVSGVSGSAERIEMFRKKFNPDIETMEGASFFFVCLSEGVKFAEVRAISNCVEPRDKSRWNIPLALKNLSQALEELSALLSDGIMT